MLKPRKQIMKGMGWGLMAFAFTASTTCAADGFAVNVTGGEGGATVIVNNASDFKTYVEASETHIVQVSGTIDLSSIGGKVNIQPNKTITGIGAGDSHTADLGKLHVTFHHNWWDMRCVERMLSVRYGRVHNWLGGIE